MKSLEIQSMLVSGQLLLSSTFCFAAIKPAAHLILLSGQSNMVNLDPVRVFIPEVEKYQGAENVVVVKVAQKGQPIRRWYKKWNITGDQDPDRKGREGTLEQPNNLHY